MCCFDGTASPPQIADPDRHRKRVDVGKKPDTIPHGRNAARTENPVPLRAGFEGHQGPISIGGCKTIRFIIIFSKMPDSLNLDTQALNATMRKFGAPQTCISHYQHWCVMLRPAQVTLGSLVMAAYEPVRSFAELSPAAYTELRQVTGDVESSLKKIFGYDKMNYLMLMMVDPDVHFHAIPRYAANKEFAGREFVDKSWPGPPDLGAANESDPALQDQLVEHLRENWCR